MHFANTSPRATYNNRYNLYDIKNKFFSSVDWTDTKNYNLLSDTCVNEK
jgi:hypothetical protein